MACPCCTRDFKEDEEVSAFADQLKLLMGENSPLLQLNEANKIARRNYKRWQEVVKEKTIDILEYQRLATEVTGLEADIASLQETNQKKTSDLKAAEEEATSLKEEIGALVL